MNPGIQEKENEPNLNFVNENILKLAVNNVFFSFHISLVNNWIDFGRAVPVLEPRYVFKYLI